MLYGYNIVNVKFNKISTELCTTNMKNVKNIKKQLSEYLDPIGIIDGKNMMKDIFPDVQVDIFISHSHVDRDLAVQLANWLYKTFNLTAFIDSEIWGYSDELLKKIDKDYCFNHVKKTYDYESRNSSTAYVHMMLASSLSNVMAKCKSVFFLNTPNSVSITPSNVTKNQTLSPWIFYELATFHNLYIMQMQNANFSKIGLEHMLTEDSLKISLPAQTEKLYECTSKILNEWQDKYDKLKPCFPLSILEGIVK